MRRHEISEMEIQKRTGKAKNAFPDAVVENYESIIPTLSLPDNKDCHVLAAAIKSNAQAIVTNNLADFPSTYLAQYGLHAKSADEFLSEVIDLNQSEALKAFRELVINRRNPDLDEFTILQILRKHGSTDTADYLHALI